MKRILIVEDDPDITEALKDVLVTEGFNVFTAADGQEGLNYLRSANPLPDVILLDLIMPIKNGYEFRKEQLEEARLAAIPVIVMTANRTFDSKLMNTKGFLGKPLNVDELLNLINDV